MENTFEEQSRLDKARKKIKAIRGFYSHLAVYIFVNTMLLIVHWIDMEPGENFWQFGTFSTILFWGIGLLCHAFGVFGTDVFLGAGWEERKIREYMDKKPDSGRKWE